MPATNSRRKAEPRRRQRLPLWATGTGTVQTPMKAAIDAFAMRTGIDPFDTGELAALMYLVRGGLNTPSTSSGRGRPAPPGELTTPMALLVNWLGPTDAALALMISTLHSHPKFPALVGGWTDVRVFRRRLEQRLEQIRRRSGS